MAGASHSTNREINMRSRNTLWIICAVVLLAAAVWILRDRSPAVDTEGSSVRAKKQRSLVTKSGSGLSAAGAITKMEEKDRRRLEEEGERLVKEARNALETNDATKFGQTLDEIIHRYKGDPNPLILEFTDVLEHDDPQFRIWAAGLFLLTNLRAEEAVQVLRDIVRTDAPLMYGREKNEHLNEEYPPSDYRYRAADILALYRIEEARQCGQIEKLESTGIIGIFPPT